MAPDLERGASFRRYPSCCPAANENRLSLRSTRVQLRKSTACPRPIMALGVNTAYIPVQTEMDLLAGSPTEPSPLVSGRLPLLLVLLLIVLRAISKRSHRKGEGFLDTHDSAIDRTSFAFSYQGRLDGGNIEPGINGVSLGHSTSVNASASVPSSQLCGRAPIPSRST